MTHDAALKLYKSYSCSKAELFYQVLMPSSTSQTEFSCCFFSFYSISFFKSMFLVFPSKCLQADSLIAEAGPNLVPFEAPLKQGHGRTRTVATSTHFAQPSVRAQLSRRSSSIASSLKSICKASGLWMISFIAGSAAAISCTRGFLEVGHHRHKRETQFRQFLLFLFSCHIMSYLNSANTCQKEQKKNKPSG